MIIARISHVVKVQLSSIIIRSFIALYELDIEKGKLLGVSSFQLTLQSQFEQHEVDQITKCSIVLSHSCISTFSNTTTSSSNVTRTTMKLETLGVRGYLCRYRCFIQMTLLVVSMKYLKAMTTAVFSYVYLRNDTLSFKSQHFFPMMSLPF